MTHNKFGRRYKRHQEKHRDYFEGIARRVVEDGRATVDLGVVVFAVRLHRRLFRRFLEFIESDGSVSSIPDVSGFKSEELVGVIADYVNSGRRIRAGRRFRQRTRAPNMLRVKDVVAYLRVSHQRGTQMYAEGELPKPDQIDGIGPLWKPARIERWAEREWRGTRRWRVRPKGR